MLETVVALGIVANPKTAMRKRLYPSSFRDLPKMRGISPIPARLWRQAARAKPFEQDIAACAAPAHSPAVQCCSFKRLHGFLQSLAHWPQQVSGSCAWRARRPANLASTRTKVEEMMVVGRWLVNECHGAQPAIARLAKRLSRLDSGAFQTLLPVLNDMGQRSGGLSDKQR